MSHTRKFINYLPESDQNIELPFLYECLTMSLEIAESSTAAPLLASDAMLIPIAACVDKVTGLLGMLSQSSEKHRHRSHAFLDVEIAESSTATPLLASAAMLIPIAACVEKVTGLFGMFSPSSEKHRHRSHAFLDIDGPDDKCDDCSYRRT